MSASKAVPLFSVVEKADFVSNVILSGLLLNINVEIKQGLSTEF